MCPVKSPAASLLTLAVLALAGGCGWQTREIEFVVPDGFSGPFIIIDGDGGQSGAFRDGKLTLTVPDTRILVVDDDSAFSEWTTRTARYANGDVLAIDNEFEGSLTALRGGGHSSGVHGELIIPPHHTYYVGTESELLECDFSELESRIATRQKDDSN